ncbi:MAG: hypothetical protein AB8H86_13190 [Polyangiales bacterium]
MAELDPSDAQVLYRTTTGIVLRWRSAIIQYRNGPLDGRVFDIAAAAKPSDDGGPVALLGVLGPGAITPDLLSRMHQRRVLKEMLERVDGYSAVVIQESVQSAEGLPLSSRLVTQASSRMEFMSTVGAATRWLGERTKRGRELEALWKRIVTRENIYGVS